jgi:hypothetical protein
MDAVFSVPGWKKYGTRNERRVNFERSKRQIKAARSQDGQIVQQAKITISP